jgi:septal ring factor EnvC (AmiA/AmiB activator)
MDAISIMNGLPKLLMTATCLPVLSLLFTIQLGSGAEPSTIKDEMTQERGRLEQLKKKIAETKKKATKAKKKHGSVLKNIEQLDQQLYRKKKEPKKSMDPS